jgi:hypothetical protein
MTAPAISPAADSRDPAEKNHPSAAALRANAEAEERRRRPSAPPPPETKGRDGPDPVRYGDWEVKGVATDF